MWFQGYGVVVEGLDDGEGLDAADTGLLQHFAAMLELFFDDKPHAHEGGARLTAEVDDAKSGVAEKSTDEKDLVWNRRFDACLVSLQQVRISLVG